jgi:hypothetical protein
MAREKKNTVDYFPHPVKDGDRMYVMETKYGMTGYACYYKLLQLLGRSENHFADFNATKTIMTFSASLKVDEVKVIQMLSDLAELGAIDIDLWSEKRIAWCQELVDSISTVYSENRRRKIPSKPHFTAENAAETGFSAVNGGLGGISPSKSTQSKVKESKEEESKEKALIYSEPKMDLEKEMLNSDKWKEETAMVFSVKKYWLNEKLICFLNREKIKDGFSERSLKDLKEHFSNYLALQPKPKTTAQIGMVR